MRYYILTLITTSKETEDRQFTPYNSLETAERKYHEALTGIGGGSFRIATALLDNNINVIKKEVWQKQFTITLIDNDTSNDIKVDAGSDFNLPINDDIVGWSTTEGETIAVDNPYHVVEDVTLYAIHKEE